MVLKALVTIHFSPVSGRHFAVPREWSVLIKPALFFVLIFFVRAVSSPWGQRAYLVIGRIYHVSNITIPAPNRMPNWWECVEPGVVTNCAACSNHDFGIFILNSQFYTVAPPGLGWVDNNQLVMTNGFHSPDTKFPFSKLGTSTNSHGLTYSYHQFDNFTLVEDVFNGTVSAWISSTNITLSA